MIFGNKSPYKHGDTAYRISKGRIARRSGSVIMGPSKRHAAILPKLPKRGITKSAKKNRARVELDAVRRFRKALKDTIKEAGG